MSNNIYGFISLIGGGEGSLDAVNGNDLVDKDYAFGVVNGVQYAYWLDDDSGATENSPYIIAPDTNPGTKRWILVAPVVPFSHVQAQSDAGQSITSGVAELVIFEDEIHDVLNEYNPTTGLFTALYNGYYQVNAYVIFDSATWAAGEQTISYFYVDGALYLIGPKQISGGHTGNLSGAMSTCVKLAAGQTLGFWIYQNQGASQTLRTSSPKWNWLTIDRIA